MATTSGERRPELGNSRGVACCYGLHFVSQGHNVAFKRQKWRAGITAFSAGDDGCLWIPTGSYAPVKFFVSAKSFRIVIAEEIFGPGNLCEETVNVMVFSADKTVNCWHPEITRGIRWVFLF